MNEHEIDEQLEKEPSSSQATNSNSNSNLYTHHQIETIQVLPDQHYDDHQKTSNLQLSAHLEKSEQPQEDGQKTYNKIQELYLSWLELLIQDQLAISQLLQAETSHIEAFLSDENMFSSSPSRQELVAFQETVGNVFDALNERQRIHLKLIDASFKLFKQGDTYGI